MKWYVAEIIVGWIFRRRKSQAIAERQIKVLRAPDDESAYQRALELGKAENPLSPRTAGKHVRAKFVGLANLVELWQKRISDGTEVYSSLEYGNSKARVRRKRDLSVFWFERNQKNRIARALLHLDARELVRGGKKGMKWYAAETIVRCRVPGTRPGQTRYDRQIKVLRAADDESAYRRALKLGKRENHAYLNAAGEKVVWEFVGLAALERLLRNRISDGTEIRSSMEPGDPKALVRRKRDLTVFWYERNKHRTAAELLQAKSAESGIRRRGAERRQYVRLRQGGG